ncbi:hypothetical protein GCM10008995_10340 [Halobellus salinus]|uniref:Transmembrane glycoprotein / HTH domain protein n=1 Tax=Halobellus salinus TaxID=931585 RepID=A0A830EM65_9EURY|nr:hypothetical protein [Halobellus salinus]GGJ02498.1 hypothetical protein GCM10008995_10340 [Halobellus salinus]SMP16969.1 hypothetical protein SAMN06265347_10643 [Halobellus salinus]
MRTSALWIALLLVVAAVAPASAFAAAPAADADRSIPSRATQPVDAALGGEGVRFQTDDAGAAPTTVEVSLREDRSAFWRIEAAYALETDNETAAFRTVADRYESGEADVGPNAVLFETIQRRASEATGREMAIANVTYHSSVDDSADRGTLALTFRWSNFLRAGENGTLVLDDAFRLPTAKEDRQRTWLSVFDRSQQIRIRPPDEYTVTSTSIPVQQRENAVVLAEPSDFEGESALRITYTPVEQTDQFPVGLLAGIGVVAVVAVAGGVWVLRQRSGGGAGGAPPATPGDTPPSAGTTDPTDPADTDADGTPPTAAADDSDSADGEDVDLSLLSDEERVERLLAQNDGRMKQATIVDEMGWSDAKVSQLLSAMADEGRINKLRLGRENLISLPDDDAGDNEAA